MKASIAKCALIHAGVMARYVARRFDGRTLREVAEYVLRMRYRAWPSSRRLAGLLTGHIGTIGAKTGPCGRVGEGSRPGDVELVVACCELPLPELEPLRNGFILRRPRSLPLAVCWLRYAVDACKWSSRGTHRCTRSRSSPRSPSLLRTWRRSACDSIRRLPRTGVERWRSRPRVCRLRAWQLGKSVVPASSRTSWDTACGQLRPALERPSFEFGVYERGLVGPPHFQCEAHVDHPRQPDLILDSGSPSHGAHRIQFEAARLDWPVRWCRPTIMTVRRTTEALTSTGADRH